MRGELRVGGLALVLPASTVIEEWRSAVVRLTQLLPYHGLSDADRLYDRDWWDTEATDGRRRPVTSPGHAGYDLSTQAAFAARVLLPLDPPDELTRDEGEQVFDDVIREFFNSHSVTG